MVIQKSNEERDGWREELALSNAAEKGNKQGAEDARF